MNQPNKTPAPPQVCIIFRVLFNAADKGGEGKSCHGLHDMTSQQTRFLSRGVCRTEPIQSATEAKDLKWWEYAHTNIPAVGKVLYTKHHTYS